MYLHTKDGFFEIDLWDRTAIPVRSHMQRIRDIGGDVGSIFVVRARTRASIAAVLVIVDQESKAKPLRSPAGWDYQWRTYLTTDQLLRLLTVTVARLDYRNFKSWTSRNAPQMQELAHDVWSAARKR